MTCGCTTCGCRTCGCRACACKACCGKAPGADGVADTVTFVTCAMLDGPAVFYKSFGRQSLADRKCCGRCIWSSRSGGLHELQIWESKFYSPKPQNPQLLPGASSARCRTGSPPGPLWPPPGLRWFWGHEGFGGVKGLGFRDFVLFFFGGGRRGGGLRGV